MIGPGVRARRDERDEKRRDEKRGWRTREDIPPAEKGYRAAAELADTIGGVPAIVLAWYPGEEGGTALADVLFGAYNPAGRLPLTMYRSIVDLPPYADYDMRRAPGRTYRYFTGTPLYPFGYGLSYTTFRYTALRLPARTVAAGDSVHLSVHVTNTGTCAGDAVLVVDRAVAHVGAVEAGDQLPGARAGGDPPSRHLALLQNFGVIGLRHQHRRCVDRLALGSDRQVLDDIGA